MAGIALVLELLNKNRTVSLRSTLHSHGFFSAKAAVSSAASSAVVAAPFSAWGFLGKSGSRIVHCDAGAAVIDDFSSSIYKGTLTKDTIFHGMKEYTLKLQHDHGFKEYPIELQDFLSGFDIAAFSLTTLKFVILFILPLLEPYFETSDNTESPEDDQLSTVSGAINSCVKCTFREAFITTVRRILERFVYHSFSRRTAWKFLKDAAQSAARKAVREMPTSYYIYRVGKTTLRGHSLLVLATWITNAGTHIYRYSVRWWYSPEEFGDYDRPDLVRIFRRRLALTTVRCLSSLILAPIGAGVGARLGAVICLPGFGQCIGCFAGDFFGPVIVEIYKPTIFPWFRR